MTRVQQSAASILFVAVLILGGWAWSQDRSPSDLDVTPADATTTADVDTETETTPTSDDGAAQSSAPVDSVPMTRLTDSTRVEAPSRQGVITNLTIFVLAVFLGIEVISKVPPTLHTPLMSGSNAISGIALVGAVIVASAIADGLSPTLGMFARFLGFIAVTLAMINAVGGFMVTHRMLAMFTRK